MKLTFEETLVRQCAPTLAGMKPGSLFCFGAPAMESVRQKAAQWHARLRPLGVSVVVLLERQGPKQSIIYVYRRNQLERLLSADEHRGFLARCGYRDADCDGMLAQLCGRLRTSIQFPHEIGVFLGYPLQDVIGFIENRGQNFTCCGFWKSYSDPAEARKCFACYQKCIADYTQLFGRGVPIEKLAMLA